MFPGGGWSLNVRMLTSTKIIKQHRPQVSSAFGSCPLCSCAPHRHLLRKWQTHTVRGLLGNTEDRLAAKEGDIFLRSVCWAHINKVCSKLKIECCPVNASDLNELKIHHLGVKQAFNVFI